MLLAESYCLAIAGHEPAYSGSASGHHTSEELMSDPRVIKKYPNRRLYDTVESRYITLADVRRLVVEKIDFVVVDKKNNADITRSILLQVIAEQEHLPEPILTQDFMVNVIRSYGSNIQASVSGHLEQTLKQFLSQHHQLRERPKPFAGEASRPRAEEGFKALSSVRMRDEKDRDDSNLTK
jgi:polyhydroxyalkanoate synthesis repressor PhaR